METTVESLEGNKVRLRVAVPAGEFETAIDAAFRKLAREVRIPGFRPGKAPRRLLEAHLGTGIAREQAIRDAVPDYYLKAVEAEDLDAIAPPEFEITAGQEEGDVEFDAVVEVRPQVEIEGYDSLQITIEDPSVLDPEIDVQIDNLRERFADLEESTAPLGKGDYAQLNIKGYVHDEEVPGLTVSDFLYEVGSNLVVPKLDEELEGKRPGDMLKFNDELPARWGERAGQEVGFQVLVKETKRKVLPQATDEWVQEASEFDTLEDLRADIRKRMESVRLIQANLAVRDKVLQAVGAKVAVDIPEPLIQEEVERRLHSILHRLEEQGASVDQYLEATGLTQDQLLADVRLEATKAVKADLALRAVVAAEEITASDDEVEAEIARVAERSGRKPAQLRKEIERGQGLQAVRSELSRGKALQFLVDHATVVDEEGKPLDISFPEPAPEAPAEEPEEESQS
ncbi:MAG TPA: trigger factor [Actinomycetota bacterium]|nr:trigger factor [Actinomycetota bacterium]